MQEQRRLQTSCMTFGWADVGMGSEIFAYIVRGTKLVTFVYFPKNGFAWNASLLVVLIALQNNFHFSPVPENLYFVHGHVFNVYFILL